MVAVSLPHNFTPRPYQLPVLEALDDGFKRAVAVWHRRAGKEKTFVNYTAKQMQLRVGTYFYLFPTYAQGKKVLWDGRDKDGFAFLDHFPAPLVAKKNEAEMRLEYRNGSALQVIGTDKIDSIVGTNPLGCVFSEYALQDPLAWDYLRPILRENGGWSIFDYTPRGKNHGYDLYEMARGNPDWFVSLLTVVDTQALTPSDIDAERREGMDEELIAQEYYCSFEGSRQGSYYGKQIAQAEADGRICAVPPESIGVETWWDIGVGDSTAIWFTQSLGREVLVIDYLEASGEALAWYAKELQAKPYVYLSHNGPHDLEAREWASGGLEGRPLTRKDTAAKLGIDFRIVPNVLLDDGINSARTFLGRCRFDREKCKRGLAALSSYRKEYDERLKTFRSYPLHDWSSHGSDAFRYLAVGHRSAPPMRPPDKHERIIMGDYGNTNESQNWMGA